MREVNPAFIVKRKSFVCCPKCGTQIDDLVLALQAGPMGTFRNRKNPKILDTQCPKGCYQVSSVRVVKQKLIIEKT